MFKIVPEGEKTFERTESKRVWSLVYKHEFPFATYYAEWSLGCSSSADLEVRLHLVLGKWEGAAPEDRFLVRVVYREAPKPGFMVIDMDSPTGDYKPLAGRALTRQEVLADPQLKKTVFELLDQIWLQDNRIKWETNSLDS